MTYVVFCTPFTLDKQGAEGRYGACRSLQNAILSQLQPRASPFLPLLRPIIVAQWFYLPKFQYLNCCMGKLLGLISDTFRSPTHSLLHTRRPSLSLASLPPGILQKLFPGSRSMPRNVGLAS